MKCVIDISAAHMYHDFINAAWMIGCSFIYNTHNNGFPRFFIEKLNNKIKYI